MLIVCCGCVLRCHLPLMMGATHARITRALARKSAHNKIIHALALAHIYICICICDCVMLAALMFTTSFRSRFASLPFACITKIPTFYQIFINLSPAVLPSLVPLLRSNRELCTDFGENNNLRGKSECRHSKLNNKNMQIPVTQEKKSEHKRTDSVYFNSFVCAHSACVHFVHSKYCIFCRGRNSKICILFAQQDCLQYSRRLFAVIFSTSKMNI